MTRHARNEFPSPVKRAAYERSGGICECHLIPHVFAHFCGLPLGDGNTFYEHINPDRISGRNDLDNCAVLTRNCWRFKTDQYDLPVIAKNDRQQDSARGIKSRWRGRLPGARDSDVKMKINQFAAQPVNRRTGERL